MDGWRIRSTAVVAAAVLVAALAGACGDAGADQNKGEVRKSLRVGLALDVGGPGDLSANDSALSGLDRARKDYDLTVEQLAAQPGEPESARETRLRLLAGKGLSPVIAIGPAYAGPLRRVAKVFPKTKFLAVAPDECVELGDNVRVACFADEQGAVLMGAAAALKSRTGTVALITDPATPLGVRLLAGFRVGAEAVRPGVRVLPPDGARPGQSAAHAISQGADVLFAAASSGSIDVIRAAAKAGRLAIGFGVDLHYAPRLTALRPAILTSMVRHIDLVIPGILTSVADNFFTSSVDPFDLVNDGVSYTRSGGRVEDIRNRLEKLQGDVIDRKVKVPGARNVR